MGSMETPSRVRARTGIAAAEARTGRRLITPVASRSPSVKALRKACGLLCACSAQGSSAQAEKSWFEVMQEGAMGAALEVGGADGGEARAGRQRRD